MKSLRRGEMVFCAVVLLLLTGCSSSFSPKESALYISRDGTVTSAEIESFDNSAFPEERYSEEGLRTFVEEAVIAYNQDAAGEGYAYADDTQESLPVSIDKLEVKDSVASLYLKYASCTDYLDFNGTDETVSELSVCAADEAAAAGISLDGLVDRNGSVVDTSRMQSNSRTRVVTIVGKASLVVNGRIVAVSKGVSITGRRTAQVNSEETAVLVFQ